MRSKVSVILVVYNGENYVAEAIESILAQDYADREVVVVNDGSTDRTQEIIDSFGGYLRSIYQPNQGLGAGRNTGIDAASGDYLAFLDHDDLWPKTKLSVQMAQMTAEEPILFSHVQQFICPTLSTEERRKVVVDESILPGYIAGTMLLSKKRFLQVGYFREQNEVGDFIDWYLRAQERGAPMRLLGETLLFRRVHRDNMGRKAALYTPKAYLHILKASLDRRRETQCLT